jgi:hypothetical protein
MSFTWALLDNCERFFFRAVFIFRVYVCFFSTFVF